MILSVSAHPGQSMLTVKTPQAQFVGPSNTTCSFTVSFTADLKQFDGTKDILVIPDILTVRIRLHNPLAMLRKS